MARSEAKRQKKLAKRKAKRNEKRREISREKGLGLPEQLARCEANPPIDCYINLDFEDRGLASLHIGRKATHGEKATVVFLVDTYCLGVKDCFGDVVSNGHYREQLEKYQRQGVREIDPASARRLIEDAVEYAHSLGLSPHADYPKVKPILNGIDPADAGEIFEMGKDGKPFFMDGPHMSKLECRRIIDHLTARCGPGGFDYMCTVDFDDIRPGEHLLSDA